MRKQNKENGEKYEIIIRKFGVESPVETDVMGDWETQEVLRLIGKLNLRSAYAS